MRRNPRHMPDIAKKLDEGWEAMKRLDLAGAERLFASAAEDDPREPDAWNGLGAVHFERAELEDSLAAYAKARDLARERYGGEFPKVMLWIPEHKPGLRAMHGVGINLYRMGRLDEAKAALEELIARNPEDNQGAHFLLEDVGKKRRLWKP